MALPSLEVAPVRNTSFTPGLSSFTTTAAVSVLPWQMRTLSCGLRSTNRRPPRFRASFWKGGEEAGREGEEQGRGEERAKEVRGNDVMCQTPPSQYDSNQLWAAANCVQRADDQGNVRNVQMTKGSIDAFLRGGYGHSP